MLEELECSGIGTKLETSDKAPLPVETLWHDRAASNSALVQELVEDPHAHTLLKVTRQEATSGRMTAPRLYVPGECDDVLYHPRFGVEQEREDGSLKVRPVDNLSWSRHSKRKQVAKTFSVNGHVSPSEKLKHDTLDVFAHAMTQFVAVVSCLPGLLKVAAFSCCVSVLVALMPGPLLRRPMLTALSAGSLCAQSTGGRVVWPLSLMAKCVKCCLLPRLGLALVMLFGCQVFCSRHNACPFGAIGSVHGWERIGAALAWILRKLFKIAVFRYVDDFFACERWVGLALLSPSLSPPFSRLFSHCPVSLLLLCLQA